MIPTTSTTKTSNSSGTRFFHFPLHIFACVCWFVYIALTRVDPLALTLVDPLRAENTRLFSPACLKLWLQQGFQGAGEMWIFSTTEVKAIFTISCCGGEKNLYLVNREKKPTLSRNCETGWLVSKRNEGAIIISVFATGVCRGEGELCMPAVVGSQ